MFIVFEGGEGCGKTTQAQRLYKYFLDKKKKVVLTREPGGTKNAEVIRQLLVSDKYEAWHPYSEFFLILAARVDHYEKFIKPHLEKGYIVICDRFLLSTLVYQGYGRGIDREWMKRIHRDVFGTITIDKTFIFSMSPKIALSRVDKIQKFEELGLDFHEKVDQGYKELGKDFDMIDVEGKDTNQVFHEVLERMNEVQRKQCIC